MNILAPSRPLSPSEVRVLEERRPARRRALIFLALDYAREEGNVYRDHGEARWAVTQARAILRSGFPLPRLP